VFQTRTKMAWHSTRRQKSMLPQLNLTKNEDPGNWKWVFGCPNSSKT